MTDEPHRKRALENALAARGIYCGTPAPIYTTTSKETPMHHRLATPATNPNDPERVPLPPDVPKAIEVIAKALVLPADASADTMRAAFEALLAAAASAVPSPEQVAASARYWGISEREVRMCHEVGCAIPDYVARKRATARTP